MGHADFRSDLDFFVEAPGWVLLEVSEQDFHLTLLLAHPLAFLPLVHVVLVLKHSQLLHPLRRPLFLLAVAFHAVSVLLRRVDSRVQGIRTFLFGHE